MTTFTATPRLVRLGVRRDRVNLGAWTLGLSALAAISVTSVSGFYPTEADRVAGASFTAGNRLSRAFDGPASGTDIGAMTMVETYAVLAVLAGLMSIMAITRLTRQDEETGRSELLEAAVVGRRSRLAAALVVVSTANLALAAITALVLMSQDLPVEGSIVSGLAIGAAGLTFGAVAAVSAQVSETQRGATGIASGVLGAAFLLRAVGDAAGTVVGDTKLISAWPSWLSPIGWGQQARPFSQNQWDVFILFAVTIIVLVTAAFWIGDRRDHGAGILKVRAGPETAGGALSSPLRLLWRLQRGIALAWLIALCVMASAFASLGDGADEIIGLSEELEELFTSLVGEGQLIDAYIAFVMSFIGIMVAAFVVQTLLRVRTEESTGRIEHLLAGSVGRRQLMFANVALAAISAASVTAIVGIIAGLTFGVATGEVVNGLQSFGSAAVVQVPAVIVVGGFVVAVVGLLPRASAALAWGALVVSLVMGQLGMLLDLPQIVMNLSPFAHVPPVPASGFTPLPIVAMTLVGIGLCLVGVEGFRRRDIRL